MDFDIDTTGADIIFTTVVVVGATVVVVVGTTPVIEFEALDAAELPM